MNEENLLRIQAIAEAALLAARRNKSAITMDELTEAVERAVAGLERKSRVLNEKERRVVAYHEAGHAIVGELVDDTNPVQKISIIPRGVGALGYTLNSPVEDRYLMTKPELLGRICGLLGGRAEDPNRDALALVDQGREGPHRRAALLRLDELRQLAEIRPPAAH